MKLLIIDDSMVSRMITKKVLASLNAVIVEASNGKEGIQTAEKESPSLIILDLLMPEMDGFEVLKILRKENTMIPVVVLSADIQDTTRNKAMKLGAAGFIHKPPESEALTNLIISILE
ncbi:MAG: response regulator [Spirochaetales bacterium]|nr:response regulator [Spirochaetales bacterium]